MHIEMSWFKILFLQGDPEYLRIKDLACQHHHSKKFAIYGGTEFSPDDTIGYDVLYLSPGAALACEDILKPLDLQTWQSPDPDAEGVGFWCGDSTLLRQLKATNRI